MLCFCTKKNIQKDTQRTDTKMLTHTHVVTSPGALHAMSCVLLFARRTLFHSIYHHCHQMFHQHYISSSLIYEQRLSICVCVRRRRRRSREQSSPLCRRHDSMWIQIHFSCLVWTSRRSRKLGSKAKSAQSQSVSPHRQSQLGLRPSAKIRVGLASLKDLWALIA